MMNKKAILITGCSSGIGLHCAHALQERGYLVIASARRRQDVEKLKEQGLTTIQLDLADSASIDNAVKRAVDLSDGKIYALFNNGAFGQPGAVEDLSRDLLRTSFETNLFGTHELTCKLLPHMRKAGEGRIVQNSSVLGFIALPFRGAYNASKFALEGLTDTLRLELADTNIHVSLISPGPIISEFRKNALNNFTQNIDFKNSVYKSKYEGMLHRLNKEGAAAPGTLGPEAVLDKLIHALESKQPKPRYHVTWPTHMFGVLKRIFSTRMLDNFLRFISRNENKA
jgi:NAD(P)-dependent dehydrogenase (short-subunit alcohol dehydrogenase family)